MMPKLCFTLFILVGILNLNESYADEIKQQSSRKQIKTPAASRILAPARAAKKNGQDTQTNANSQTRVAAEASKLDQEFVKDTLDDLRVKPEVAAKIVKEVADPEQSSTAKGRVAEIAGAAADIDLVSANQKVRDAVVDAVSRSDDPKATADQKVGEAAIDEVFGKDVTKLVPKDKLGRSVFTSLVGISSALQNLGADPDDPEVVGTIKEGAKSGVNTPEAARIIMENGAQKVLDKQGFTPAKPGESLDDRLSRMVEEQKILQAELDAKKVADAAKAAAKARVSAAAKIEKTKIGASTKIGGSALTQGAAGSTAVGRSVSAKVEVAVGGGSGSTSGAGKAKQGTGIVTTQTSGTGGQNRSDLALSRLAAGPGGSRNTGKATNDNQPPTNPATDAAPATGTAPATNTPTKDVAVTPAPNPQETAAENTPVANTPPAVNNNPQQGSTKPASGNVASPNSEFMVQTSGGNKTLVDSFHTDYSDRPDYGKDTQIFSDGTFKITETARNSDGSYSVTVTTGTWAIDGNGERKATSSTTSTTSTTSSNGQSRDTSNGNNDDEDDDSDKDDDKKSEEPPAEDPAPAEETEATSEEESTEASTTPNPLDIGGGDATQLSSRTGGRLGNQEARRQQRALDLARFGGAAGPNPNGKGRVPTLLTPEEMANAEKALNMRRGAGVTNPNPLGKDSVVATDRDLKEMYLRGNGGAKGPTEKTTPVKPQDPRSPIGGNTPSPIPSGGTRINASKLKGSAINQNIRIDKTITR
jgi:hypothetical protein